MKFFLIVAGGKKKGLPIPISVDLFTIGSDKACQLRSHLPGIGSQHCALVARETKVFIRDLNSGEPTVVNGSVLPPGEEWPLHKGDRMEVGPLEFILQLSEKALSQRDLEEWALGCLDQSRVREFDDPDEHLKSTNVQARATSPAQAAAAILDRLSLIRGEVKGRLRVGREGTITTIRFNDQFLVDEAEIAFIKKELHEHLNKQNLRVLLDFKNIRRMSTVALAMIDDLNRWLRPWGSSLALCRVRAEIQNTVQAIAITSKIPIFSDKIQALTAKW